MHYFIHKCAPSLCGSGDADFWTKIVLQISQAETAVHHAILAISALYEDLDSSRQGLANACGIHDQNKYHSFAILHYNFSMRLIRLEADLPQRKWLVILAAILFTCIEFLLEDSSISLRHIAAGSRLLHGSHPSCKELLHHSAFESSLIHDILEPMYGWLHVMASLFGRWDILVGPVSLKQHSEPAAVNPKAFSSIAEADAAFNIVASASLRFASLIALLKGSDGFEQSAQRQQGLLRSQFHAWEEAFAQLESRAAHTHADDLKYCRLRHILLIRSRAIAIVQKTYMSYRETAFDSCLPQFEAIVDLSEACVRLQARSPEPSRAAGCTKFTFELGIIPQLWFTITKCRHPSLRRRAIALLSHYPVKEALWDSRVIVKLGQRVVEIEEQNVNQCQACDALPREEDRLLSASFHPSQRRGQQVFHFRYETIERGGKGIEWSEPVDCSKWS